MRGENRSRLGRSEFWIGPIGIGCWAFGGGAYWGEQSQRDVDDVVGAALDRGINLFDTAEMYNDGLSEISLGKALGSRREEAIIITKFAPSGAYAPALRRRCEDSLARLGTDYIDIYMLHWPINRKSVEHFTDDRFIADHLPTVEEAFDTLNALKKEGKIRGIGVSNHGVMQMREVCAQGVEVAVNEMPYNVLSRAIEPAIAPECEKLGIGIVGAMTLMQGILAGIYRTADDIPGHQAHSRHFRHERGQGVSRHREQGCEAEVFAVVDRLRTLADELHVSMAQLSVAWTLSKRFICCALVGSRNLEELTSNLAAAEMALPPEVAAEIDRVSLPVLQKLGANADYYENAEDSRIW